MVLSREPTRTSRFELDVHLSVAMNQAPLERAQRVHDAVGVMVRRGAIARLVSVFEHPYSLVLEDDLVLVGIGDRRILAHIANLSPASRMRLAAQRDGRAPARQSNRTRSGR